MSFVGFEREMIRANEARDKIAASRREGNWAGGPLPFEYKLVEKKLVVGRSRCDGFFATTNARGGRAPAVWMCEGRPDSEPATAAQPEPDQAEHPEPQTRRRTTSGTDATAAAIVAAALVGS